MSRKLVSRVGVGLAGAGTLVGTLNNSRSVQENSYNKDVKQLNVTINSPR